jgi:DNA-3-methyladenine glycosylase
MDDLNILKTRRLNGLNQTTNDIQKLSPAFYQNEDVVSVAEQLLGKHLCTNMEGQFTSGIITETEAYNGITDKASHAFGGRRTSRTETMYHQGGVAYIYLCYGIHSLFNVVTGKEGIPQAVLIRAIAPVAGIPIMEKRRGMHISPKRFSGGPGTLAQALGIHYSHSGISLNGNKIWIEDHGSEINSKQILAGPRVGVESAGEDALLPYRFRLINFNF